MIQTGLSEKREGFSRLNGDLKVETIRNDLSGQNPSPTFRSKAGFQVQKFGGFRKALMLQLLRF